MEAEDKLELFDLIGEVLYDEGYIDEDAGLTRVLTDTIWQWLGIIEDRETPEPEATEGY